MSHFTVLVIGQNHVKQLAPFHEYECTGIEDEYVIDVDITDEAHASYETSTDTRLKDATGVLHSFFDDAGEWRPEFSQPEPDAPEWSKGRRTYFVPEGFEKVEVPTSQAESFAEWVKGYYGIEPRLIDGVEKVMRRTNPNAKWDWYEVGGRWTGFFKLKKGFHMGLLGRTGLMTEPAKKGYADAVLKSSVDFDGMREEAGIEAGKTWDLANQLTGGGAWEPWESVRERMPIAEARFFYNEQSAIVALRANEKFSWEVNDTLAASRASFVEAARDRAISTWAIVKDSHWFEKGSMGWWGMSSGDMDQGEWNKRVNAMLDALPDDTQLTLVDCHI